MRIITAFFALCSFSSFIYAQIYEAENQVLWNGATVSNIHSGYSGSGFIQGLQNFNGSGIEFQTINVPTKGNYNIILRYANAQGNTRKMSLFVNGRWGTRLFLPTGTSWQDWKTIIIPVQLKAGNNNLKFMNYQGDDANLNIDRIEIAQEPYDLSYNTKLIRDAIPVSQATSDIPLNTYTTSFDQDVYTFNNNLWNSKWNEADVFRTALNHGQSGFNYTIRFGRGGQIYSYNDVAGELLPPQGNEHAWVDDCLLATLNQYDGQDTSVTNFKQGYVHQAGIYQHYDYDTSYLNTRHFFSPLLSEHLDTTNRQYSTINWGQMSTGVSPNRSDVLIYQNTKDLGNGVTEITYMVYNYNGVYPYLNPTDISAWGGIRTSNLPYMIRGNNIGGTSIYNGLFAASGSLTDFSEPSGWIGATQNPWDNNSRTMLYVFGKNPVNVGTVDVDYKFAMLGKASNDFSVLTANYRTNKLKEGRSFFFRMYLIVGGLLDATVKAYSFNNKPGYMEYGFLNYSQTTSPTIAYSISNINGQNVLVENPSGNILLFSQPVNDSKPLFLIRNRSNGKYLVSSDPYILNTKFNIPSQYDPLQRVAARPYDGNCDIVKLLGFAMPSNYANASMNYVNANTVLTDTSYFPGNGLYDTNLKVLTINSTLSTVETDKRKDKLVVFPNPTKGSVTIEWSEEKSGNLQIFNALGQNIHEEEINNKTTVVLPSTGVYFTKVKANNGKLYTKKIIVSK